MKKRKNLLAIICFLTVILVVIPLFTTYANRYSAVALDDEQALLPEAMPQDMYELMYLEYDSDCSSAIEDNCDENMYAELIPTSTPLHFEYDNGYLVGEVEGQEIAMRVEPQNWLERPISVPSVAPYRHPVWVDPLIERLFVGEGDIIIVDSIDMVWYHFPFGGTFVHNSLGLAFGYGSYRGCIPFVKERDLQMEWLYQFETFSIYGWRNQREQHLRSFIFDFGITKEQIIHVQEQSYGLPMEEIDTIIYMKRNSDLYLYECARERFEALSWTLRHTSREIEALYSDDIYFVWDVFPGFGVIHNGNVYSPEWVLTNMKRAIMDEQIPIYEIERILAQAAYYPVLDDVRLAAEAVLHGSVDSYTQ